MTCLSGLGGLREAVLGGAASFCSSNNKCHPAQTWVNILRSPKMTDDSAHSHVIIAFSTIEAQTCTAEQ